MTGLNLHASYCTTALNRGIRFHISCFEHLNPSLLYPIPPAQHPGLAIYCPFNVSLPQKATGFAQYFMYEDNIIYLPSVEHVVKAFHFRKIRT